MGHPFANCKDCVWEDGMVDPCGPHSLASLSEEDLAKCSVEALAGLLCMLVLGSQLRERGMVLLSVPVTKEVREWLRNQSKLLGLPQGVLIGQMIEPWEKAHDVATERLLRHILEHPSKAVKEMAARETAGEDLGDVLEMTLKGKAE